VPSREEAEEIATRFLDEHGLRPERFSNVRSVYQTSKRGLEKEKPYMVTVAFYPEVDGCAVYGVSRIVVDIDENGDITALRSYYRNFVFDRVVDLTPPEDFYDTPPKGLYGYGILTHSNIENGTVSAKIVSVELAYWEDQDQPFLQPVWVFNGISLDARGVEREFQAVVPAIKR
jgi:hypothetical protein